MTVASAPGKMILLGEYAVLEGTPALVYAVNRRARVSVCRIPGNESQVSAPSLSVPYQPFVCTNKKKIHFDPNLISSISSRLIFFKHIFESLIVPLNLSPDKQAMSIELVSDAFYDQKLHSKLGFGSSSALTVALTKALIREFGLDKTDTEIFRIALDAHRSAQGKIGSGIDVAASSFGGAVEYQLTKPNPSARTLEAWTHLNMAVIWTGKSASTSRMVQSVSTLRKTDPELFRNRMQQLSDFSNEGIAAYKAQDTSRFLSTINHFNTAMQNLGDDSHTPIISEVHHKIAQLAKKMGGAYKPSGAGGGDIGLLFTETAEDLIRIHKEIQNMGLATIQVELDTRGVALEDE